MAKDSLKILSLGNSFAVDTSEYLPTIASDLGYQNILIATLYIGGCSINRHLANAQSNARDYKYYTSYGNEWNMTPNMSIEDAIKSENWDFISIQHGTGDGSRYTLEESYKNLPCLVEYIKQRAPQNSKIVFNMAWVMDTNGNHPEIRAYNGDQLRMYQNLIDVTRRVVLPTKYIDTVSFTGTAVQNARATDKFDSLCRDGFHLSYTHGRYVAALTFLGTLTEDDLDNVSFVPQDVSNDERKILIECAKNAIKNPYWITK